MLSVTDRDLILERGNIVYEGVSTALQSDRRVLETHLGVAQAGKRGFDMTKATHA